MKKVFVCLVIICHAFTAYALDANQKALTEQETINAINKLIADLTNEPLKSEDRFIAQLATFQQGIADLDDDNVTLFKTVADQAYNQEKYQLFSAITGLLNDYYLFKNTPIRIQEKLVQLESLGVLERIDDSLRVELEIDRLLSWNHLYESQKTINHISELDAFEKTARQEIKLINLLGEALSKSGNLSAAVEQYLLALELLNSEALSESYSTKALILSDLGVIHEELSEYDRAIEFFDEGLAIAKEYVLLDVQIRIYSNRGIVYKNTQQYELAIESYNKGLRLARELGDEYSIAQNLYNIGNIYLEQENFDLALTSFESVEKIVSQWGRTREYSLVLTMLGKVEIQRENYDRASNLLLQALEIQMKLDDPIAKVQLYEILQDLTERQKDYEKTLMYHELAETLSDSIDAENQRIQLREQAAAYEIQKAEYEKRLLEKRMLTQEIRSRGLAVIFLTIIGFVVVISVYQRRQSKTEQKLLEYSIRITELSEKQKELSDSYSVFFSQPKRELIKDNESLWDLFNQMIKTIVEQKLYKEPDFNVSDLAKTMKSNTNYVSTAINMFSSLSFNHFINRFRINESKRLMAHYSLNRSLEQIMEESGFQNRATFYRAFKNEVGVTPAEFRHQIKKADS